VEAQITQAWSEKKNAKDNLRKKRIRELLKYLLKAELLKFSQISTNLLLN
jgi:hypothetical protein